MAIVRKHCVTFLFVALFSPLFAFAQSYGDGNFGDGTYGGSTSTITSGGNNKYISLTEASTEAAQEDPEITALSAKVAELQKMVADLLAQLGIQQESSNVEQANKSPFLVDLELGSESEDVKRLQQFLNGQGFVVSQTGPGSIGNETIYFGTLTRDALVAFQTFYSISPAVGYFGPITRAKVNSLWNN